MLGVFLDRDTMAPADLDFSNLESTLPEWRSFGATAPDQISARIAGAQIAVVNKVKLDRAVLENASALRLVCLAATGTDNVDLNTASRLRIPVCNVRGYGTAAVCQHVFALILALSTRLLDYHAAVRAGRWQTSEQFCLLDYPIREIAGKTLGIVGYGDLGRGVARLARAFGMEVLVAQRPGGTRQLGRLPLATLLPRVDMLSLHCPLTPHTRGLIGRRELAQMKPDALLINTARGGIVDEAALAEALRNSAIGGAGVDVLSVEPPGASNPLLATPPLPNLIVTPHIAWGSREARQRIVDGVAENIRAFHRGERRNWVT